VNASQENPRKTLLRDLAAPVKLAAQQDDQRDDGEDDHRQRHDGALMTIEAQAVADGLGFQ
jgi:hypothetical protein